MRLLIRNANVVFPHGIQRASLLIEGGRIAEIDPAPQTRYDELLPADGLYLLPGIIDDQVHFREPGLEHKEDLATASHACAAGGITTFLEMPNTKPLTVTSQRLAEKQALAASKSLVNYGFYIGATCDNLAELQSATDTPGIKIFMGSSTGELLVDDQAALERIFGRTSLPICAHCEDEATVRANAARFQSEHDVAIHSQIRSAEAALIATRRAIDLATRHRHRFHVLHVSTAAEIPEIAAARPWVTAEACLHHFLFTIEDYARLGTRIQMNPSLKTPADAAGIWQALLDNNLQVIATDHAPHTLEEKAQPYPNSPSGLPAVENSLALMLDQAHRGRCTLMQIAQWMSDAPARIWGLVGKGRIAKGYDADLALVDLSLVKTVRDELQHTKCRWSPWHGESLTGWPVATIVGGQIVYRQGRFDHAARGTGPLFDHKRGGYWATTDGIGLR
jgi:dihydroorotase